jgi:hypothetical protein
LRGDGSRHHWRWRLLFGGALLIIWRVTRLAHQHVGLHAALAASNAGGREMQAYHNLLVAEPIDTLDERLLQQRGELLYVGRRACCLCLKRSLQLGAE